jgi:WD40 repeat protein
VLKFFYHDQRKALDIADELKSFLQRKFLYWLEAHSCMQTQRDSPGTMLPLFLEWTTSVGDEALKNLLLDYIKFEKRFREGYMLSAPQIYYSGLVFAPQDSLVPQLYSSLFHNLITVSGDVDIVWPSSEPLVIHGISRLVAIAFSPDGTRIVSGSDDKTIRVWDAVTGQQVGEALRGHQSSVRSVAFSPDGTRIVSGS